MNHFPTFPEMLDRRASLHPDRTAILFLDGDETPRQLSYGELWQRCLDVAAALDARRDGGKGAEIVDPGRAAPRAMLLFPPGLEFITAFVGCQIAGWIPVPTGYPKPHRAMPRLDTSVADCDPALILSDSATLDRLDRDKLGAAAAVPVLAVDTIASGGCQRPSATTADSVAFLQYTSGSTSSPKGVIVSQRNLMTNLEVIRRSFGLEWGSDSPADAPTTGVFWLPHFHDMGLIGGILTPLNLGYRAVLMNPQSFVRRPILWLQAVDRYRAVVTGGPNFAFELCADRIPPQQADQLDLSCLKVTFCGAEPIRPAALRSFASRFASVGFREESFYPCYGLAESTLLVAGGRGPGKLSVLDVERDSFASGRVKLLSPDAGRPSISLVSCGFPTDGHRLVVVDPETARSVGECRIGEIWICGESVSQGYWNHGEADADRFSARLVQRSGLASRLLGELNDGASYFRTGDLGFLHQGKLYVTGRQKELIIVRGRNHFPQDIETTVLAVSGSVARVAAYSVATAVGESLAIMAEIKRGASRREFPSLCRQIRQRVIEEHEIDPREIFVVPPATIPVTTSGKIRRNACQQRLSEDGAQPLHQWRRSSGTEAPPLPLPSLPESATPEDVEEVAITVRDWIVQWLVVRAGVEPDQIDTGRAFGDYGFDSMMAIELIGDLEDSCGTELTPMLAWEHPTIDSMARLVASRYCEGDRDEPIPDRSLAEIGVGRA